MLQIKIKRVGNNSEMEESKDEECFTFVGIMKNEFTSVKVEKEESDDLNLFEDLQNNFLIKSEKVENVGNIFEVSFILVFN